MSESENRFENWLCKVCGYKHTDELNYVPDMKYLGGDVQKQLRLTCIRCGYFEDFPTWIHYQD